jgi:motility quorum-sensing regulator/GCU-specific mRNA interferase toxin
MASARFRRPTATSTGAPGGSSRKNFPRYLKGTILEPVEKRLPHHSLALIQATFSSVVALRMTRTALGCAEALGITLQGVVDIIQALTRTHFYKSMTSHVSSNIWQDVYHVPYRGLVLYVKFMTDAEGYLVVSLKEK